MKTIIIAETILSAVGRDSTVFGRGGIALHPARTAEDALALHREKCADLIIADHAMPAMGGVRLCEAIRADEALRGVSIILACETAQADLPALRAAGANAVIPTPVDALGLFTKMFELLVVPQRKDMRALLRVAVTGGAGGESFFATSENISISGMLLESNYRFKEQDRILCTFFIGHSEVKVDGVVMRAERSGSGRRRYGVRFLNPPTRALVVIEQYVKSRVKGGASAAGGE